MDRSFPRPDGPDTPELDDDVVEALLARDPAAGAQHPELADLLADVRVAYQGHLPRVHEPLAALVADGVDHPSARSTDMSLSAPGRIARFALAVVVTALMSGGLALAGALDGPPDETASDTTDSTVDTTVPETTVPDTTVPETTVPEEPEEDEETEYRNHGQEVSDFARTTELEGCEKGRAISELASGKDLSHRPPCGEGDDDEPEVDDDEESDEVTAERSGGGPGAHGKGHGRGRP